VKLHDVITSIRAPKGVSTIIAAFVEKDFDSVQAQNAVGMSRKQAEENLKKSIHLKEHCTSDWAYWGYAGDVAYWKTAVNLLRAAELVGPDNLPDVPIPDMAGVVMDVQWKLEQFGEQVLKQAQELSTTEA